MRCRRSAGKAPRHAQRSLARRWYFSQCSRVQLTLPERFEASLSPATAALHLAIGLFVAEEATLGQAAEVARLSQSDFLKELGRRRISIHYGLEELTEDLRVVESLSPQ
jgi:predicted HTH domain antitoxin